LKPYNTLAVKPVISSNKTINEPEQNCMTNNPSVALVILNWNTSHYLKRFLPSLLSTSYQNKKIYVIDNNSSDDSLTMLASDFPEVEALPMKENKGYAEGYNFGLAQIKADYYLLINSDLQATPGFIEPLIDLLESNPQIAACQPKLLSLEDKKMFEYAGAAGGWIDKLGFPFAKGRILTTVEEDYGQYDSTQPVFWATGACMLLRATVYQQTGGFYGYYYMHQEDIDLCWRMQNMGYEIYTCPSSVVYHIGGGSLSWENHLKTFLTFRNNYIMLARNLPLVSAILLVTFRLAVDFWGSFYFALNGEPGITKAMLKAEAAFFYWLFFQTKKRHTQPKGWDDHKGIFNGTILFPYFFKNKRKFSEIVIEKKPHA